MLASAVTCCAAPAAMAGELKDAVVVYMHDGSTAKYILEQTPIVTFVEDKLHVESSVVSCDHNLSDVDNFRFEQVDAAVESIAADEYRISVVDNTVLLQGFTPGSVASLTDIEGRTVARVTVGADGEASIALSNLATGVYIVSTTDGKTFKLLNQ